MCTNCALYNCLLHHVYSYLEIESTGRFESFLDCVDSYNMLNKRDVKIGRLTLGGNQDYSNDDPEFWALIFRLIKSFSKAPRAVSQLWDVFLFPGDTDYDLSFGPVLGELLAQLPKLSSLRTTMFVVEDDGLAFLGNAIQQCRQLCLSRAVKGLEGRLQLEVALSTFVCSVVENPASIDFGNPVDEIAIIWLEDHDGRLFRAWLPHDYIEPHVVKTAPQGILFALLVMANWTLKAFAKWIRLDDSL